MKIKKWEKMHEQFVRKLRNNVDLLIKVVKETNSYSVKVNKKAKKIFAKDIYVNPFYNIIAGMTTEKMLGEPLAIGIEIGYSPRKYTVSSRGVVQIKRI